MNDFNQHFKQIQEDLALSSEERSLMRTSLEELTNTPVVHTSVASPYSYLSFFLQPSRALAFLLVVAVLGGGTAVAAAETALPGDVLYSVKINVNEEMETVLAFSPRKKAEVEIRHAEERLQEVQLLAASGHDARITEASHKATLQIENMRARVKSLLGTDASGDDIESELSFALGAHADILDAQAFERDDDAGVSMSGLALVARGDDDSSLSTSAERAQKIVAKAQERIDKNKLSLEAQDALLGELTLVKGELAKAEERGSVRGFALAERHAYRVLALVDSSERITQKTGKKPFISFEDTDSKDEGKNTAAPFSTQEDISRTAATLVNVQARSKDSPNSDHEDEDDVRILQFRVSDSSSGSGNSRSDKDDDSSHSGSDSSESGSSGSGGRD